MNRILFILAAAVIITIAVASGEAGMLKGIATALAFGIAWRPEQ